MSDEIVLVAPHSSSRECYHAAGCSWVGDNFKEYSKETAEHCELEPCSYCLGEIDWSTRDNQNTKWYEWALENE